MCTITGSYYCGKALFSSLASLPKVVVAIFQANIHADYLKWVDIPKLQADFPQRVEIVDEYIWLNGPVVILSPGGTIQNIFTKIIIPCVAALVMFNVIASGVLRATRDERKSDTNRKMALISFGVGLAAAGLTCWGVSQLPAIKPGIYFGKWPFVS